MIYDLSPKEVSLTPEQFEELKKSGQLVIGISVVLENGTMHGCSVGTTINVFPQGMTLRSRMKWLLTGRI